MGHDPVTEAIDEVEATAARLHQAVDAVAEELVRARQLRREGRPITEIVEYLRLAGGRELRLMPMEASVDFERAVTAYRTAAIKELVDVEGMTFTKIAALSGVSRQMVARLYRAAGSPPNG
jgi:hypothetical protein